MKIQDKPIGVFDSGLGGLTAVKEIIKLMPNENVVYFGDTERVPYGDKHKNMILKFTRQAVNFMKLLDLKMLVAACGTVSSIVTELSDGANKNLGLSPDFPFVNVVFPSCLMALRVTKNKKIGIIGTTATITSNSYKNVIRSMDKNVEVFQQDCPLLVPMIENEPIDSSNETMKILTAHYLKSLKDRNVDTLIMGCTHYPLITDIIADIMGEDVTLINSGYATAQFIKEQLKEKNLQKNDDADGKYKFYISKSGDKFLYNAQKYLKMDINFQEININKY